MVTILTDSAEEALAPTEEEVVDDPDNAASFTWFQSVRKLVGNKNFAIFLITAWIYSSFNVINRYFNLYLRDIGFTYVVIGVLISFLMAVILVGEFVAGYLADNRDRKNLSAITMAVNGVAFFMLSIAVDLWLVVLAFLTFGLASFTGKGGTAYIMEQMDRRFGGVGVSLFTLGTVFGLVPLFVITVLFGLGWEFVPVMRLFFFGAGVAYVICSLIRIGFLDSTTVSERPDKSKSVLKDLMSENMRGIRLLMRVFPVFVAVLCLDALSDSFYGFANLYYVNETLNFGIGEINLMMLITLLISVPLTLYLGRVFDKHGGRKLTIIVYSVMPLAISMLIVAQYVPYIAPPDWINALDTLYPGLSVVLSLAFIATAIKSINDVLWMLVINTYIQKSLPRKDLGKMLSLTTVFVLSFVALGPIPAGIIYELFQGLPLLYMALGLNIVILIVLLTKSIEPKVSVEELEAPPDL
jgi:MFS family permease